jgi:hypothetical protein
MMKTDFMAEAAQTGQPAVRNSLGLPSRSIN